MRNTVAVSRQALEVLVDVALDENNNDRIDSAIREASKALGGYVSERILEDSSK